MAYAARGMTFFGEDDQEHALDDYTKVLELDANYAKAYRERGEALAKTGQKAQAIEDMRKYLAMEPAAADRSDVQKQIDSLAPAGA